MSASPHITVLLAEDHEIVRTGLRRLLEVEADIEVLGEVSTGRQAVETVKRLHPAVVVMDIAMPLLNGVEATREIMRAVPGTKVLMLSAHADDAYVEGALASGAVGYLVKQNSVHTLMEAIREVHKGNTFFSPAVAARFHKRHELSLDRKGLPRAKPARLSPREVEVLQLIAEGEANKQIAAELGISIKTVEKHRDHLMRNLDIHDTASLTRYAIAAGIIECNVQLTVT
jgi:DNA-binding NarL/FixJ family response regulator